MFTCGPAFMGGRTMAPANITQVPMYAIIGLPPLVKVTQAPVYAISQPAPELKVTQVPVYAIITL